MMSAFGMRPRGTDPRRRTGFGQALEPPTQDGGLAIRHV